MKRIKTINRLLTCCLLSCSIFMTACGGDAEQSTSQATSSSATMHTVTFDSNGGTPVESQQVAHGEKVTKPKDPTKKGYSFVEWLCEDERWSFIGYVVTSDMTLKADWSINTYHITYNLDGGTNNSHNPAFYTVEDEFTLYEPTKEHFIFTGWTLDNVSISKLSKGTTGDLTLVANWSNYVVNVLCNDSSLGEVSGGGSHTYGSMVTLTATPHDNAEFAGWFNSNNSLISKQNPYMFVMSDVNVTYTAKFFAYENNPIDELVFSNYAASKWYDCGSHFEKVIDNKELTFIYNESDMHSGDIPNDGWCGALLYFRNFFVSGNSIKVKMKYTGNPCKLYIRIVEKDQDTWFYSIDTDSLSSEYLEVTIPYTSFHIIAADSYGSGEQEFTGISSIQFGVEMQFGTGTASFKDFQII